jgi:hypothetical protein
MAALMASTANCSRGWAKSDENFWHTSCDTSLVARKLHRAEVPRDAAQMAAINLRMATIQLAGLRVPPRARKIPTVRRRLPVTILPTMEQPVIIRHVLQNLGSVVSETRPAQSPPV